MSKRKSASRQKDHQRHASTSWQLAVGLCLLVGLSISLYLLWRHIQFASNGTAGADTCQAVFGTGCDETLLSETSYQFGLPLAGWGTIYYGTILSLLATGTILGRRFQKEARAAAFLMSILALIISFILAGFMLSGKSPFCPLCAIIHTLNLVLVFALWKLSAQNLHQSIRAIGSIFSSASGEASQRTVKILGMISTLLVGLVLYLGVSLKASSTIKPDLEKATTQFQEGTNQNILVESNDPILGPYSAPAQLVVFSDFECPHCRAYSERLSFLKGMFGEQLQIVFKHFPLDISCNPIMRRDLHHFACEAAYSAEAARRQGKFWAYHDLLFHTPFTGEPGLFSSLAESAGLDLTRFEEDRTSQDVKSKVASDIRLGMQLHVNSTPTLFLNGRRVQDLNPEVVENLIQQEIRNR